MYSVLDLIRKFFITPIWERSGYNWVNTIVYGVLLGIAAVITYKTVKKTGYRFNLDLFLMFLPFLVMATAIRALVDSGKYPYTYLLISPGIYFTTMAVFAAAVVIGLLFRRFLEIDIKSTVITIGIVLASSQLVLLIEMVTRPIAGVAIVGAGAGIFLAIELLRRLFREREWVLGSRENAIALWCHLLDATVTFIGIDFYGYAEQHVLPNTLIDVFGTGAAMYLLKLAALPLVLYLLDTYVDDEEMNVFIKIVIMVLGLAPAARNSLRIVIAS
jgi:uncharacterized membrane protein